MMTPVANRPSHCNSAWPAITRLRGIDISVSNPNFSEIALTVNMVLAASDRSPSLPIEAPEAVAIYA
ncbi:MAG TPA: hypothetical protein VLN61_06360 [Pseudolabrys sp.]|nr:hypothetical protein [Pseudolabrys sp.]